MFALIGETLRRLRRERGLTLEELGERAELGRGQLSRIENHKQEATLSTLAKILACQGVSRREFFRRYDLVESEVQAIEREKGGAAASSSPPEVHELVGRLESFLQSTLQPAGTVAQGAIEVGDLVVLFRVVPRSAAPPPAGGGEAKPGPPGRSAGARKRKR
ncbi:MAG TPA: helix-turn-helix transcriptional regulator [Thermoanaerobaculia bacterium]|jgi:transcriptional regulator with XRE-family HTH domain|nr:helix-turn-helix transcriptional regulator [Thermoanaerobaculia bacterium]